MFANAMNMRVGAALAGLILAAAFFTCGGWSSMTKANIQIEFGIEPNELLGSEVEIDGEVVGTLKMFGNATRTGFIVKEGEHEVRVLHPDYESKSVTVEATPGRPVLLILDLFSGVNAKGESTATLGFQF